MIIRMGKALKVLPRETRQVLRIRSLAPFKVLPRETRQVLIIGLGNPGKKFQKTRHNLGFRVVEEFQKKNNFPGFEFSKKFLAEISEGEFAEKKIILAKPQTFMNLSGKSTKILLNQYRGNSAMAELPRRLLVVHDDIDLPLGKIRIAIGRGGAGHKGVESIIKELGSKNFIRFRVGINRFAQNQKSKISSKAGDFFAKGEQIKNQKLDEFVLKKFTKEEEKIIKEVVEKAVEAIEVAMKEGIEKTMTKFN